MKTRPQLACLVALLALILLPAAVVTQARAAASHVVISEFASRGSVATDEFVELYNPTDNAVSISGWHLQYRSATGSTWSDRAVLPGGATIQAHAFYLVANPDYVGAVTADYQPSSWSTGIADDGNIRITDPSSVEVDKVGYGTGNDPEGGSDAPRQATSGPNGNSVERKALVTSTADSLAAGGAHALLGNGQDTNVNGSDFVLQTHGRNPQNSANGPEPVFSVGGNGTGTVTMAPTVSFTEREIPSMVFTVGQDSAYTLSRISIRVPPTWTWSHLVADVVLAGPAFSSATPSVSGDTVIVTSAAITTADGGTVTVSNLTSPSTAGTSNFIVHTAVAGGAPAPILVHPHVRVLDLVPIVDVHINNPATGVPIAPYAVGSEATVTGVITANLSPTRTDLYLQDGTAGIDLFDYSLPPITIDIGDSLTVTGSISQFRGQTELVPDWSLVTIHSSGHTLPEPLVLTCAQVNATFHPDGTEPNESRLVRINGVTYNPSTSTITDASGTTSIFIPNTYPPTPAVFDLVAILKQYKPGTTAPGPPYLTDYEVAPRTPDDIIAHPGPIILTTPFEDQIQATSVRLNWTTDVASTSIVYFGLTAALGDSVVDPTPVTWHSVTVPGLTPATVYNCSVGSEDANGRNFAPTQLFSTASPPAASEQMNVYFNKSVNTTYAWLHPANGNQDLTARLVTRLNNAKRSVDGAIYNLSGTPGSSLATALINAKNRGVKVRIICEYDNSTNTPYSTISSNGIPLINDRYDPINAGNGLMHNKFLVIDGRGGAPESVWVWTGSWNPTDPGTNDDLQNSIEIQDPALAGAYTLEFNEMWGSSTDTPNAAVSRFGARKLDNTPHRFNVGGHAVECYFSPSDATTSHIVQTLNLATHSIAFELLTITRTDISAALIAKHNAAIPVRGDMDNSTDTGSQYAALVAAGVDVHLKSGVSGLLHHKYALIDAEIPQGDAITLTGSHNWSSAAENNNNENTLIIHDPDVTNQYFQEFAARYVQFGGTDPLSVGVEQLDAVPHAVSLSQNFPNPFHDVTHIEYSLPVAGKVSLRLFDIQGRQVQSLVSQRQAPGRYQVDLAVNRLKGGVYFYRLQAGGVVQQRKLLILN